MCLAESYGLISILCGPCLHLISKEPMRATVPATEPQTEPRDERRARIVTLRCGAMADRLRLPNDLRTDGPELFRVPLSTTSRAPRTRS